MGSFTIDLPYDSVMPGVSQYGAAQMVADPRPGMWGVTSFYDCLVQEISGVPAGKCVQLTKFRGTLTAALRGIPAPGTTCYLEVGFITQTNPAGVQGGIQYFGPVFADDGSFPTPLRATGPAPGIDPRTAAAAGCDMVRTFSLTPGRPNFDLQLNEDLSGCPPCDSNNAVVLSRAIFLNDTGCAVHTELVGVFEYEFV
jgi:hypothetical protein